jgi:YD repeat-containing protein
MNANGNLTARGNDDFTYDQANRLKTAVVGGVTSSYAYDGDGKRASQTVGGTTTRSVYDVGGGLPVLLDDVMRDDAWAGHAVIAGDDAFVLSVDACPSRCLRSRWLATRATGPTGGVGCSGRAALAPLAD